MKTELMQVTNMVPDTKLYGTKLLTCIIPTEEGGAGRERERVRDRERGRREERGQA